ncbi:hypothetical protein SELMODRAFT_430777 [Selaginella moellendorffii]|uniref:Uncharacterized protein n=1 Tax=Selaginella moellendorffii TaxID=88036 RepID=D8TAH4_SELML|nr:hypothetical protein SELMODRAFT_430777 [Selaginella moellendorffii]
MRCCHGDRVTNTRVLAVHPKVENFTAFTSVYNDSGLFGIHASSVVVNEDIGRQILTYGCRKPAKEFIDTVRELTLDDIGKVAEKIISTPLKEFLFSTKSPRSFNNKYWRREVLDQPCRLTMNYEKAGNLIQSCNNVIRSLLYSCSI